MKHIVSMHQSQYLPWPPFFKKMALADTFVLMDTVQFQKNGIQNRNQINSKEGALWLTIPVKAKLDETIRDKRTANQIWAEKHIKSLQSCYGKAPNFDTYFPALRQCLSEPESSLHQINLTLLKHLRKVLGISNKLLLLSDLELTSKKSHLVLETCQKLQASCYVSGQGGRAYLNSAEFTSNGIEIQYLNTTLPTYPQIHPAQKGLSIIDWLMNDRLENIQKYLFEA
jgi:hypothetical protein